MANRFLNNININDQYTFPSTDGSAGQAIITDGAGNLTFGSAVASSADSTESVHISVKNTSGAQILKGTPVYVKGETGNSGKIEIAPADAADENKMPALGLLESTLDNNGEGFCVQGGLLEGLATATIDGTATTANKTVYVKPGGGLTMTKPTGTGLIQNIAKVARVHASNGTLVVSSILRTNDVPNLTTGKIWVGDGNTTESTVVHLDEVNGRMGIGTTSPDSLLEISQQLSAAYTIDYPYIISSRDDGNSINQQGGEGVGIKFRIAGNDDATPGNSLVGASIAAIRERQEDADSSTGLGFFITQNDETLDEAVRIDHDGNVGIGTTSPDRKLEVQGVISSADAGLQKSTFANVGNDLVLTANADATNVTAKMLFNSSGAGGGTVSTKMIIDGAGNVGIGTTSPSEKLEVNGTIKAGVAGNSSANLPALLVTASGTGDEQASIAIQQATAEGDTIIFADYDPYVEWGISTENSTNKIQFTGGVDTGSLGSKTLYNNAGAARTAYIKLDHNLSTGDTSIGGNLSAANLSGTNTGDQDLSGYLTTTGKAADSDLLDGIDSASFLRSDEDDSFGGNLTSASSGWIKFYHPTETDFNDGKIGAGVFDSGLNIVGAQTTAGTGRQVRVWGSLITSAGNSYWHSGNDGVDSGLDADLLDGQHASDFASSAATSLYDLLPNGAFTTTYAFTSTAGTWAEVMEGNDVITSSGTYSIQVWVNDYGVGGTQYDEYYSGTMSWFAPGTNDDGNGAISEIVLHRAGHAANTGVIYLRTRETTSAETNKLKLEVMSNKTYTGASNLVFKFVRLI